MLDEPDSKPFPRPFGRFTLLREIGRGAMGVVFEARQRDLERSVALKLLLDGRFASRADVERFLAEARAAAQLDHPGIARVYDVGEQDGQHYFTMERVEGRSLAEEVAERKLAPERAARLLAEAADAIHYAHERGVVHRDLKPRNILIDAAGRPRITDFGLAKRLDADASLTGSGEAIGTPAYMAPEQASGDGSAVGPAADVYGLGAVLYTALSGRPLFLSPTALGTLRLVEERDPIRLRVLEPSLPRDLETICHACLHKLPTRRYATAAALAQDLRRFLGGEPIRARPVGALERAWLRARRRPGVTALWSALVLGGSLALALVAWQARAKGIALADKEEAERARTSAHLAALAHVEADAVPTLWNELDPRDPEVASALRAQLDSSAATPRARLRALLALLASDATLVDRVLPSSEALHDEPEELALAVRRLRELRERFPAPAWEGFLAELDAAARERGDAASLTPVVLACALHPEGVAWQASRGELALELATVDPYLLPAWEGALAPLPRPLLEELASIARGAADEEAAVQSARILARRGAGETELIAELLPAASDAQFAVLLPALRGEERAFAPLKNALQPSLAPDWRDAPLPREAPDDEALRALAEAGGLADERWAFAPDLAIDDFLFATEALRAAGYRPLRARPRAEGELLRVAAVWTRDGLAWELGFDLGADELDGWERQMEARGLAPVDLASWVFEGTQDARYVALAAEHAVGTTGSELFAGRLTPERTLDHELRDARRTFGERGFRPDAFSIAPSAGQGAIACTVWQHVGRAHEFYFVPAIAAETYARDPFPRLCQMDIACWPDATARATHLHFAGAWYPDPRFESRALVCASAQEHRAAAAALAALGFRPRSLAACGDEGASDRTVASVWLRPLAPPDRRRAAERQRGRAALALLELGDEDAVWERTSSDDERELRAQLVVRAAALGVDPRIFLERLERAHEAATRRMLVLALGGYDAGNLPVELRARARALVSELYVSDADPGVHSAASWALRSWGLELPEIDEPPADARWFVAPSGLEMIALEGPSEFLMGAPGSEPGREPGETPHRHLLRRSYALSARELTQSDLDAFFAAVPSMRPGFTVAPNVPTTSISFFQAIAFCRWLGEHEGVSEDEQCYPPLDRIGPGMRLDPSLLDRTGYRLPTEAEWEYACRAGSLASYSFGSDPELLPAFAHCRANSLDDAGPVARFRPNDFGFFDMHGNVSEWCTEPRSDYLIRSDAGATDADFEPAVLASETPMLVRGGSYDVQTSMLRCAARARYAADSYPRGQGLRIARTLR